MQQLAQKSADLYLR